MTEKKTAKKPITRKPMSRPLSAEFMESRTRGESHPRASVTADQVREMRRLWNEDRLTLQQIKDRLGLSIDVRSIHGIIKRHSWKHVE